MKIRRDLDWTKEDIISSYETSAIDDQITFWLDWKGADMLHSFAYSKISDAEPVFPEDVEEAYRKEYGDEFIIEKWGE